MSQIPPSSRDSEYSVSGLYQYYNDSRTTIDTVENGNHSSIPKIQIDSVQYQYHDGENISIHVVPPRTPISDKSDRLSAVTRDSPNSVVSSHSLYSSGNVSTDDEIKDLNNDRGLHKRKSFRSLFKSKPKSSKEVFNSSNVYTNDTNAKLNDFLLNEYYLKSEVLNYREICEYYIFNDLIDNIFCTKKFNNINNNFFKNDSDKYAGILFNYLSQSELESGNEIFKLSNNFKIFPINNNLIFNTLQKTVKEFLTLKEILSDYNDQEKNLNFLKSTNSKDFQALNHLANNSNFVIPLALSVYGNWLLTFNADTQLYDHNEKSLSSPYFDGAFDPDASMENSTKNENYNNEQIINYFRKSIRLSLVLMRLKDLAFFDKFTAMDTDKGNEFFNSEEVYVLDRFLNKDNTISLGISLNAIGEYFQVKAHTNIAVNIWEINGHLTRDVESCSMAIWGLSDGFGFGNKKHIHGKRKKFLVKRRIARLYRNMIENGGKEDYGSSWVWKEKYD